jgi:hypothetical protein
MVCADARRSRTHALFFFSISLDACVPVLAPTGPTGYFQLSDLSRNFSPLKYTTPNKVKYKVFVLNRIALTATTGNWQSLILLTVKDS